MLRWLAEKRIQEAIDNGEFDDYPGKGEPFPDDFFTQNPYAPPEGRNNILSLAGFLPHEIQLKRDIEVLRIKMKSKKLTPEERTKLINEISIKEVELEARMEYLRR